MDVAGKLPHDRQSRVNRLPHRSLPDRSAHDPGVGPPAFHLRFLGTPRLLRGTPAVVDGADDPPSLLPAGKPLALLAYLHRRRQPAHREHLVDLLWSGVEPERARQSLRQALTTVRRVLGPDAIVTADDGVRLDLALGSDVGEVEAALARGDFEEAVGWARGRFLDAFALPGADGFERWAEGERAALDAALVHAREALVRRALADGRYATARTQARALRDADPDRQAAWRLLLDVLVAAGDAGAALLEAAALEAWARDERRELETATARLLRRVREPARPTGRDEAAEERAPWTTTDLVGRATEFAALLDAWRQVRTTGLVRVRVVGRAGIGKSRLVSDLARRLASDGTPVATVRCAPGAQGIAGGVLADVAVALAGLPGALGVPPGCADDLVELAPALAGTFRAATASRAAAGGDVGERDRRRVLAVQHLLGAVCDDRPCALVIDDLHWADAYSAQLLHAVFSRASAVRALVVETARPVLGSSESADADGAARERLAMTLGPLAPSDVDALVRSVAQLPDDAPWTRPAIAALHAVTDGVPFAVLDLLSRLHESRHLAVVDERWHAPDGDAVLAAIQRGGGPRGRLAALTPTGRDVLAWLAVAGVPLATGELPAAAADDEDRSRTLHDLARRDLARPADGYATEPGARRWECAHDEIRDAVLAALDVPSRTRIARALGEAWLGAASAQPAATARTTLRHAARLLREAGAMDRLTVAYARWRAIVPAGARRAPESTLARDFLGPDATPEHVGALLRSRPWPTRLAASVRQRVSAGAAVSLCAAALVAGAWAGRSTEAAGAGTPTRLRILNPPTGWTPGLPMTPVPTVEVLDATGRPVFDATDSVRLRSASPGSVIGGRTVLPVREGRARFDQATLLNVGEGPVRLAFTYPGVPALMLEVPHLEDRLLVSALFLEQGSVNGRPVTPRQRSLRVMAGESLTIELDLRYTSPWPAANVVLGATPSWGDPATGFVRLASLVTPGVDYGAHARFTVRAPDAPGAHRILLAMGAEENVGYLLSGTNWSVGRPVWGDGNDVAHWSADQVAEANASGSAPTRMLSHRDGSPRTGLARSSPAPLLASKPVRVAATTIELEVVRAPAAGAALARQR